MKDITNKVKALRKSDLVIKCISKTTENKAKEQKVKFLGMLLAYLRSP